MNFQIFQNHPDLVYGFSEKSHGPMSLHDEEAMHRRRAFFEQRGLPFERVVHAVPGHTTIVTEVDEADAGTTHRQIDGFVTQTPNLFLSLTAADCYLVYFFDPHEKVLGLAHSGWRSTSANIVQNCIEAMRKRGAAPEHILAGIGPGICGMHYTIGSDARGRFSDYSFALREKGGRTYVDLLAVIRHQLNTAGVSADHIEATGECTYESPEVFFSHRRDKPKHVETHLGYVGMRSD